MGVAAYKGDDTTGFQSPATDYIEGGFGGSATNLAYGALYNLWLDPKETRNFLIRKLPYISIYEQGIARHLGTFRVYPPKRVVEMPTR